MTSVAAATATAAVASTTVSAAIASITEVRAEPAAGANTSLPAGENDDRYENHDNEAGRPDRHEQRIKGRFARYRFRALEAAEIVINRRQMTSAQQISAYWKGR